MKNTTRKLLLKDLKMYKVGDQVSLKCKFRSYYLFNETGFDEFTVEGTVIKTPSYIDYDAVTIKTNDPDLPISIVPLRTVEGYVPGTFPSTVVTHQVVSGANTYIVTVNSGKVSCSCVGFQFRRYCKHSDPYKV